MSSIARGKASLLKKDIKENSNYRQVVLMTAILNIAVQQYFIWQQRFPAGKGVVIHHSYTPSKSHRRADVLPTVFLVMSSAINA